MSSFAQTVAGAVAVSCVYLLVGMAWNLVHDACGYLNLATGEIFLLAGILAAKGPELVGIDSILVGGAAAVVVVGSGAALVERIVIRPVRRSGYAVTLTTLGIGLALAELARWIAPEVAVRPAPFVAGRPLSLGGVLVARQDVIIVVTTVVLWSAVLVILDRSSIGRAVRACADDRESARWLGIDVATLETAAFAAAAVLTTIAAVVAVPAFGTAPGSSEFMTIKSFLAVSLVGMGNHRRAPLGAFAVGMTEALTARYWSADVGDIVVIAMLVLFLIANGEQAKRVPRPSAGRSRPRLGGRPAP